MSSLFAPAPKPKSGLGYHRILSPTAAVRVSPLCLGAMNFGHAWKENMGDMSKETAFEILDYFLDHGGNFIDTASNYQDEESEKWIGEWMAERQNRDQMVIATKFTTLFQTSEPRPKVASNFSGNSAKSLHISLERSLKKLQTDYIDVLYVHWWDFTTSIEELMIALNRKVQQGKILYLGISDSPAWIVSKANQYARDHGLTPFSVYQGRWSAADRDFERDIIPMTQAEGMALAPWGALGGGQFKTDEQRKVKDGRNFGPTEEKHIAVSKALEKIANKKGTIMTSVALAYVMHKTPYVFPIVGTRKLEHLKGNIDALTLELAPEELADIDEAWPFDVGFPMNFLFGFAAQGKQQYRPDMTSEDIGLLRTAGWLDAVEKPRPIFGRRRE